jgi:hypothetical protein
VFRPSVAESDPKQFIHLLRFSVFRDTYLAVNSLGSQYSEGVQAALAERPRDESVCSDVREEVDRSVIDGDQA